MFLRPRSVEPTTLSFRGLEWSGVARLQQIELHSHHEREGTSA